MKFSMKDLPEYNPNCEHGVDNGNCNKCRYEVNEDDPTYNLARAYWRAISTLKGDG